MRSVIYTFKSGTTTEFKCSQNIIAPSVILWKSSTK
jgi:hypothetical protein